MISFFVPGTPAGQGSKRYLGPGRVVEQSKKVAPWRADVRAAAQAAVDDEAPQAWGDLWNHPVAVTLEFFLSRPKGHYGTGRNEGVLKESSPLYPCVSPDTDKLARAVLDAITGVLLADDKSVVHLDCWKLYADHGRPGVQIRVDVAT